MGSSRLIQNTSNAGELGREDGKTAEVLTAKTQNKKKRNLHAFGTLVGLMLEVKWGTKITLEFEES